MSRKGWHKESARHSLAARGLRTRFVNHPVKSVLKTFKLYRGIKGSDAKRVMDRGYENAGSFWTDDIDVARYYAEGHKYEIDSWAILCVELPSHEVTKTFTFQNKSKGHWWGKGAFGPDSPPVGKIGAMEWQAKNPVAGIKICDQGRFR